MSTETLASHVDCDEVADLVARIRAHLPCLERTAAVAATPDVRGAVWAEIHMFRVALALLGADLPNGSERNRTNLNGPGRGTHQDGTETDHG